jgi:hypothetical protein
MVSGFVRHFPDEEMVSVARCGDCKTPLARCAVEGCANIYFRCGQGIERDFESGTGRQPIQAIHQQHDNVFVFSFPPFGYLRLLNRLHADWRETLFFVILCHPTLPF